MTPAKKQISELSQQLAVLHQQIKKLENQLEPNFYLSLFEEFPAMIWRADPLGNCNFFNKCWLAYTGRELTAELGTGWLNGIHPDDKEKVISAYHLALQNRGSLELDYRLRRYDSEYCWLASTIWPYYDAGGQFSGYCASSRDISERKRVVAEKIAFMERASRAERLASLGSLTASIAHEINQPLNALKITADGILFLYKKGKERNIADIISDIQEISSYADQIDAIIKHVRSFLKNKQPTDNGTCTLNDSVDGALRLLGSQLRSHGIKIHKFLQSDLPPLPLPLVQLEQIIVNLLINAMHALDTVSTPNKAITITTSNNTVKTATVLEIADNGPGILPENAGKIFEPFFTTDSCGENMGLGLAIIESIVSSCQGQISYKPNSQGGATFLVEIPYCSATPLDDLPESGRSC